MWVQKSIRLLPRSRGFHLITEEILAQLQEIREIKIGLAHFLLKHTSAAITVNENADPSVRIDFESHFNQMVPEHKSYYQHTDEGPDDMPAHLKSSILGVTLSLPITQGELNLGAWQGIYLCEHRNQGGSRELLVTMQGQYY